MKKIIVLLGLTLGTWAMAQETPKPTPPEAPKPSTITVPQYVPVTNNYIVNQYMIDLYSMVNLFRFVTANCKEDMKPKLSQQYVDFNRIYTGIHDEIQKVKPEQQVMVAQYIAIKETEIKKIMQN